MGWVGGFGWWVWGGLVGGCGAGEERGGRGEERRGGGVEMVGL